MTDESAFLRRICEQPDDVDLRLVYADWLEERGDPRGEFIRVQCERASIGCSSCVPGPNGTVTDCACDCAERIESLRRREMALFIEHGRDWFVEVFEPLHKAFALSWVRRGFVESITCRLEDWCGTECPTCLGEGHIVPPPLVQCLLCSGRGRINAHSPAIVAAAPVREVRVTDRQPMEGQYDGKPFFWWGKLSCIGDPTEPHWIPDAVFDQIRPTVGPLPLGFRSEQEANAALSAALIRWARDICNLNQGESYASDRAT